MSTTFAPSSWPAPAAAQSAWRFGTVLGDGQGASAGLRWVLMRNCSMSPRQMFGAYLLLCAISLVIAVSFGFAGAMPVLAFAGIELVLVGSALLVYARHAGDCETITLADDTLLVEHQCGSRTERASFRSAWVRVEPQHAEGSLIELSGEGQRAHVGRYLRPHWRVALAQELRRALRGARPSTTEFESALK